MSYDAVSVALIQAGPPTLRIRFSGTEYLEDERQKGVRHGHQGWPLFVLPGLGDKAPEVTAMGSPTGPLGSGTPCRCHGSACGDERSSGALARQQGLAGFSSGLFSAPVAPPVPAWLCPPARRPTSTGR